ncbi:MAG TPA: DegT/DnrJ/EryC1/StrS aminotransferase family protein [Candidatus Binatia bacterium]|jgi:dTDP-4-amino-4,6-dideoxygalactose transaminase
MIPFSPPRIDQKIIDEVVEALKSGWITTGPRTKRFEKNLAAYCGAPAVLCLNSATAGMEIMLRWFGVGPGDEVIVPVYTYAATANVVVHCGATPVMVDVDAEDFNISVAAVSAAITPRTKVVMPVDIGGWPCDYDALNQLVRDRASEFQPATPEQKALGRILVLADSAHSVGARYKGRRTGALCDVTVFSFHAVKNLTTAEGGAVALNLPTPFSNEELYAKLCVKTLHGQNKDALAKSQKGNWKYDIVEAGFKCNMTDIVAAIGLVELERYDADTLVRRRHIMEAYAEKLRPHAWAEIPVFDRDGRTSSCHLFPLRVRGIDESQRDAIIQKIFDRDVSVNVHFQPLARMSFYRSLGYDMADYPVAYDNFAREISLPVFYDLTDAQIGEVVDAVVASVEEVIAKS